MVRLPLSGYLGVRLRHALRVRGDLGELRADKKRRVSAGGQAVLRWLGGGRGGLGGAGGEGEVAMPEFDLDAEAPVGSLPAREGGGWGF